jgi:hypothetical protein
VPPQRIITASLLSTFTRVTSFVRFNYLLQEWGLQTQTPTRTIQMVNGGVSMGHGNATHTCPAFLIARRPDKGNAHTIAVSENLSRFFCPRTCFNLKLGAAGNTREASGNEVPSL